MGKITKKKDPKFKTLAQAVEHSSNELKQLVETKLLAGFIREAHVQTDSEYVEQEVKKVLAKHHRLKYSQITDEMALKFMNAHYAYVEEDRSKRSKLVQFVPYRVQTIAENMFDREYTRYLKTDNEHKADQLKFIREKIELFINKQEANERGEDFEHGHDFNTDFSADVCMYTLHSMVYSNYIKYVESVRELSVFGSHHRDFNEWLESPESDCFVVTCYIALAEAQAAIEVDRDEETDPLWYTTRDIQRYAAIREKSAIYDEIDEVEDKLVKAKNWLTDDKNEFKDETVKAIEYIENQLLEYNTRLNEIKELARVGE